MVRETCSELRVRYAETDQMGVVYHANYLIWCEIGRTDFIRELGRSYAHLEKDGVRLAVSDVAFRFHGSARYDDPVRVYTRLTSLRSRALIFAYRIVHADRDTRLVSGTTTLVSITPDGHPVSLPQPVRDMLSAALSPASTIDPTLTAPDA